MRSLLLMHCYPIKRFDVNNQPYWQNNHDISLRKFQAFLGLSYIYDLGNNT
ncbi:MAG: hypothetical protein HC820_06525 [Hydrococcus sp. RM1_1_31]|nr:hypothetical protein [Hydrococcus sp. RM1_1_31]